eukprot:SAG31_NODE_21699_length_543_cov_0.707207_1_plen_38_part_10
MMPEERETQIKIPEGTNGVPVICSISVPMRGARRLHAD